MIDICFDIETGPLPEDELFQKFDPQFEVSAELLKREPMPHKGLKDPDKVAANLIEVEEKHKAWEMECEMNLIQQRQDWINQGALRAERGKLLAFGYSTDGREVKIIHGHDEKRVLSDVIGLIRLHKNDTFCGFNIINFDLPFIRRRCIVNGIRFPFYSRSDKWKPWIIDLYDAMDDWGCRVYGDRVKLDDLARGLGAGKKNGDGAGFAELYNTNQAAALDYLGNDILITYRVCERMLA